MIALLAASLLASKGTVVMIHGAGGGGWEYDKWRPVFERAGWTVIAKDLVPTNHQYESTQLDDYVAQVVSWTPQRGRVYYIGASMGGLLALKAQERRPVMGIVLVNSVAPLEVPIKRHPASFPPIVRWANGPLKDSEAAMPDSDRKTIRWAWKRWRDESGTVMNQITEGVSAQSALCLVLTILGEADTDVPHSTGLALANWTGATVKSYPKMSHVGPLMSRRATEVAQFALKWIETVK